LFCFCLDLVLKSNLSEPGVKKVNKKKVIWADEKDQALVHTSIFEIDVSEKVDMHAFARQCAANRSLAQIEQLMERDLRNRQGLQDSNENKLDERLNLPPLPRLIPILLPDTINIPTVKSQERFAQEERERTVLQAFSFRSFLPDTPGEPDCELNGNSSLNDAKLIPFDDVRNQRMQTNKICPYDNDVFNERLLLINKKINSLFVEQTMQFDIFWVKKREKLCGMIASSDVPFVFTGFVSIKIKFMNIAQYIHISTVNWHWSSIEDGVWNGAMIRLLIFL